MSDECNDLYNIKNSIGHEIRSLGHIIQRRMFFAAAQAGIDKTTFMQCWIIGYIYQNSGTDIFQKDIENKFAVTSSTVTHNIKMMEKKGYIKRLSVENDARLKKIVLTQEGLALHKKMLAEVIKDEEKINSILLPQEQDTLIFLLRKLRHGLEQQQ